MNRNRWIVAALLLFSPIAGAQEVRNGEALVRAMHDRYAKTWYDTLSFAQKSTTYNPDGTSKAETWYEAMKLPGKLRIDIGPVGDGNGYLLAGGKVSIFRGGKVVSSQDQQNMLLVLGFDVYKQSPEATLSILKKEGFDASKFHEETWNGAAMYVLGAEKGDLKSKQFWVEKDRLLFVRLLEPDAKDASKSDDIRFGDYRKLTGGWVAALVEVYSEGKKVFSEEYTDIREGVKLNAALFDAAEFAANHLKKQ